MKVKHILLLLLAVLAIAFMQPLITFLGGLTLLLGVGGLIFRDLPPSSQDAMEHQLLGWLRRVRAGSAAAGSNRLKFRARPSPADLAESGVSAEPLRRDGIKSPTRRPATVRPPSTGATSDAVPQDNPPPAA